MGDEKNTSAILADRWPTSLTVSDSHSLQTVLYKFFNITGGTDLTLKCKLKC